MKTSNLDVEPWVNYLTHVWERQPNWLEDETYHRLVRWKTRFDFYSDIESDDFDHLRRWQKNKKLRRQGQRLVDALHTLQQLPAHHQNSMLCHEIKRVISYELTKLEITQLKMLEKAQRVKRFNDNKQTQIEALNIHLQEQRKASYKAIRKHHYSKTAKNNGLNKDISSFFSKREGIIVSHASLAPVKVTKGIDLINGVTIIVRNIVRIASSVAPIFNTVGSVLIAIPFIGATVVAISALANFAKAWWQDKSAKDKTLATIAVILAAAAIILLGFSIIAGASVAFGLMIFGAITSRIKPWIDTYRELRSKRKALSRLNHSDNEIELTPALKQHLLIQLEEKWLQNKNHDINELKKGILNDKLANVLKSIPKELLQETRGKYKENLQLEIKALEKKERRQRYFALNSMLTIVGGVLLLIPPTTIAGAAILITSSLIGIGLTFNVGPRTVNFVQSLFKKPAIQPEPIDAKHQYKNRPHAEPHPHHEKTITPQMTTDHEPPTIHPRRPR